MKKNLLSSNYFLTWTLASLTILIAEDVAGAPTFLDQTFNNGDWNEVLLPSVVGATFTATQDNTNGNPPPSRTTIHQYPTGAIFVAHLYKQSSPYDPATQGAIVKLSYSYHLSHRTPLAVAYSILIYQNSTYYYHLPNDLISGATWTLFTGSNLTAASFTKLSGPSSNVNPDFSCKGSILVFGYVTRNSNPNPGTTDTTQSGIDNWTVNFDQTSACSTPTPTATPTPGRGCADILDKEIRCLPGGGYSYTFNVGNNSGSAMSQVLLTPAAGSTFALSPQVFNLSSPLHNGQSTMLSVNIGNGKPGDKVCFFVSLMSDKAPCCTVEVCPTLPICGDTGKPIPRLRPGKKRP